MTEREKEHIIDEDSNNETPNSSEKKSTAQVLLEIQQALRSKDYARARELNESIGIKTETTFSQ